MELTLVCLLLIFNFIFIIDSRQCLIDERIGQREGNVYYCDDPKLPVCCEKDYKATCCEDIVKKTVLEQLILWGLISVIIFGFVIVYCCVARDTQLFESDNAKTAFGKMMDKLKHGRKTRDFSDMQNKSGKQENSTAGATHEAPSRLSDNYGHHNSKTNLIESCADSPDRDITEHDLKTEQREVDFAPRTRSAQGTDSSSQGRTTFSSRPDSGISRMKSRPVSRESVTKMEPQVY